MAEQPASIWTPPKSAPVGIGPGPFRPPEPYLPLRKASPQRLQGRRGGHHPLLYTGPRSDGFRPSTSPSSASPDFAYATAVQPHLDHGGDDSSQQTTRKNSVDTMRPASGDENTSSAFPSLEYTNTKDLPPLPPATKPFARVQQSKSISEGVRSARERLAWQQEHGTAVPKPIDSSWEELPAPHEIPVDEARTSFRSIITNDSSLLGSVSSNERSSMATGFSSTSDFIKVGGDSPTMPQDDDFSVEDAITMYADGFDTPSKRSLDVIREVAAERRGSSPVSPRRPMHAHRRSRSAVGLDTIAAQQKAQAPTTSPPTVSPIKTNVLADLSQAKTANPLSIEGQATFKPSHNSTGSKRSQEPVPRDRYGFKKASLHVTLPEYEAWDRTYVDYLGRRKVKWDALMRQYGLSTESPTRFPPKSEKIKRYARKGIPPQWRGPAWFWYAGGPGLMKKHEGVYYTLLAGIKRDDTLKETDREHIERDLNRTFPDNLKFKPELKPGEEEWTNDGEEAGGPEVPMIGALRRVLQAFAVHRPGIGYCQSLNFIAGLLLLFLDCDEEKAFLLLTVITGEYLPGTHGISLEGANIDIAVLMSTVKEFLPAVWAKLDDQPPSGGPLALPTVSLATTPWFLTLFLTTLPVESALRIWDVLFIEGSKTLFRAALAIFKLSEPRIRTVADPMEVFQIVQTAPRSLLDVNTLMELCFRKRGGFGGLSQDTIERRREEGRKFKRDGKRVGTDGFPAVMESGPADKVAGAISRLRSKTKGARG